MQFELCTRYENNTHLFSQSCLRSKLFLHELAKYKSDRISVVPNNKEKYVSFSQHMKITVDGQTCTVELRFLDSYRILSSSLDVLSQSLSNEDFDIIKHHYHDNESFEMMKEKGFFSLQLA